MVSTLMRSNWLALVFAFGLTSSSAGGLGCSDCRVNGQEPIRYEGGAINQSRTIFQSSRVGEAFLHFPQGRVYQFYHGLGRAPVTVDVFVSFCDDLENPTASCRARNFAPSSGNLAVFEEHNDEMIQIRNDTCENGLYVRVVAIADPDEAFAGGAGGAAN